MCMPLISDLEQCRGTNDDQCVHTIDRGKGGEGGWGTHSEDGFPVECHVLQTVCGAGSGKKWL